jgi:regulator of sigma E protease
MLGILSLIIIVHEFGHYLVARLFGFQTPVFGFGLPFLEGVPLVGKHWVIGHRWGTEFRVHALLMGGYVAIPELGDESSLQEELGGIALKPFRKFPIWQRVCVASAGVAFNIISAYLLMLVMFFTLGQPIQPTVVHSLIKDNPIAMNAGVKAGDQLYAIAGQKVLSPDDAVRILGGHKAQEIQLELVRNGERKEISLVTNARGKVGMALVSRGKAKWEPVEGDFFRVAGLAMARLWTLTVNMVEAIGQLFSGIFSGGGGEKGPALGLQDLHGVFAVIKIGADIAQQDWTQLFIFTIMISMDIAIINIMPFPVLDGWHVLCFLLEKLRGKPLPEKPNAEIMKWGVITLLVLMVLVTVNDVSAWLQGKLNFKLDRDEKTKQSTPSGKQSSDVPAGTAVPESADSRKSDGASGDNPAAEANPAGQTAKSESSASEPTADSKPAAAGSAGVPTAPESSPPNQQPEVTPPTDGK